LPLPTPVPPLVTESHAADEVADHEQAAPVVTATDPVDAADPADTLVGASVMSHVPVWVTLTVWPAIVSDPVRGAVVELAATSKVTPPLPELFGPAPAVTVIQAELLVAVHVQPAGMVTDTTREPPALSKDSEVDDSDDVHDDAAWLIVSRRPPIAIVPFRAVPFGFAAAEYVTVPLPEPVAPVRTVIQLALGTADHVQPAGTATSTLPFPPAAATF
jgi:hypothetical protein